MKRIWVFLLALMIALSLMPNAALSVNTGSSEVRLRNTGFEITGITQNCTLPVGETQELRVAARGLAPFTFRWEVSADNAQSWQIIPGAVSESYIVADAQPNSPASAPYIYRVTVTDGAGYSDTAQTQVLVSSKYTKQSISKEISGTDITVKVTGDMLSDAKLQVTPLNTESEEAKILLTNLGSNGQYLIICDLSLVDGYGNTVPHYGSLQLSFQVGDSYNGQTLRVYHRTGGRTEDYRAQVQSGAFSINVNSLSPFMVARPVAAPSAPSGPSAPPMKMIFHTVTASAGAHGTISPEGSIQVAEGGLQSFNLLPDEGYEVDAVHVDGAVANVSGSTFVLRDVTEDCAIHVAFKRSTELPPPTVFYTVTAGAGTHGALTPFGTMQVAEGGWQTFYFISDEGYEVDSVLVDGAAVDVSDGAYVLRGITENRTIYVTFKRSVVPPPTMVYFTVAANADSGGTISPCGSIQVAEGGSQTFYFVPDEGYEVESIFVDGAAADVSGISCLLSGITENSTIRVTFKRSDVPPPPGARYFVKASAGIHGEISPYGYTQVTEGNNAYFYFLPEEGYEVDEVYLNGEKQDATGNCLTVENVVEDMEVRATFKPIGVMPQEDGCCLWERLFGGCAICGAFGHCVVPWCWIAPLLAASALAGVLAIVLRKRRR